ncbi:DUF6193 family natural product biosynthesis protein [Streptomyces scopuliridis]|uniref:DUF6193 family natural product biosynthesis protein n=1 Tax=Streptomyces scopuliridis TaxID=452529 RepID=UPI00367BD86D
MESEERGRRPAPADVLDGRLYPDLIQRGGLAPAMSRLAHEHGIVLGEIRTRPGRNGGGLFNAAEVDSDRGVISVLLGSEERRFSLSVFEEGVREWAAGATGDLLDAVKVAEAWRNGTGLEELTGLFPFMTTTPLALAYESGDPVATQWDRLLGHDEYVRERPLLRRAHANSRLRPLFPVISHGTLRLSLDSRDRTAEEIWISPLANGVFRVESTRRTEPKPEVGSMDDAIEVAASYLA